MIQNNAFSYWSDKMKVIGIIGGCGSGKSEVANLFKHKFNAYVINADKIGHEVIKKKGWIPILKL